MLEHRGTAGSTSSDTSRALAPVRSLASLHRRQTQWVPIVRLLWWALALPMAIAAWSSARLRGTARVVGYAVAAVVLTIGVAACGADPTTSPTPRSSSNHDGTGTGSTTTGEANPDTTPAPASPAVQDPARGSVLPPAGVSPAAAVAAPSRLSAAAPHAAPVRRPIAPAPKPVPKPAPKPAPKPQPAPAPVRAGTYTNSDGHQVERPDGNSAGATAICKDGTDSHSQHRSGTCSGHGGVARWL